MPLSVRIGVTVILVALALGLGTTVARARAGKLRRNGLAGVRTPSALVDDRAFARANKAAMPFLLAGAILAAILAVLVVSTGLGGVGGSSILIVAGIVLGGLLLIGGLRGERAARNGLSASSTGGRSGRADAGPKRRTSAAGGPKGAASKGAPNGRGTKQPPTGRGAKQAPKGAGGDPKVSAPGGGPRRPSR